MRHEKIYILEDKSKLKVIAELIVGSFSGDKSRWSFSVHSCAKGKRTWIGACGDAFTSFAYRQMSMDERRAFELNEIKKVAGEDRLKETADELLEILRFKI